MSDLRGKDSDGILDYFSDFLDEAWKKYPEEVKQIIRYGFGPSDLFFDDDLELWAKDNGFKSGEEE